MNRPLISAVQKRNTDVDGDKAQRICSSVVSYESFFLINGRSPKYALPVMGIAGMLLPFSSSCESLGRWPSLQTSVQSVNKLLSRPKTCTMIPKHPQERHRAPDQMVNMCCRCRGRSNLQERLSWLLSSQEGLIPRSRHPAKIQSAESGTRTREDADVLL